MKEPMTARQRQVLEFIEAEGRRMGRPPTVREIAEEFGFRSPRAASDHLDALERKGWIQRDRGRSRGIRLPDSPTGIPLVGRVAAGHPILSPEFRDGTLDFHNLFGIHDRFAVRVIGDSMIGCGIHDGDYVIVQRADRVEEGQIALVYLDGEATVKRVHRTRAGYRLEPENPRFAPLEVDAASPEFRIGGPVVGVVRRV
jgi:repressor LexA